MAQEIMVTDEEKVKQRIIRAADQALDVIEDYMDNKGKKSDSELVTRAFLLLGEARKVIQMNQTRVLTERSQALRFMPYLADDKIREEYIKLTNPQIAGLKFRTPSQISEG